MITYHQIRQMTVKIAEQAEYVRELQEVLERIQTLSNKLSNVGDEIEERRQEMSHEIRSVEMLEEILRTQVFADPTPRNGSEAGDAAPGERTSVTPGTGRGATPLPSKQFNQDVRLGSHDGFEYR